ncbi:thioredoxin-like domain-containing protein [Podospora didyma]|uniref:Thioredoxin-like domain-containing protein n=1 Tax=Podospora didyma TaxID=330526 RepID=A0AAE0U267_9PEZI|nr:thioredoxin-like domain-containing protein [Podospora didyma]
MRYPTCVLSVAIACFASQTTAWNHASETKLQDALESSGYTLIAFVLPSHDATQALETEWTSLQKQEKDDNIISFDCEAHLKTCKDLDVASFPAIRMYHRDGRMDRYRGPQKAREFALFLRRALRPTVLDMGGPAVDAMTLLDDVVIMAHPDPDDDSLYERFTALAKRYRLRFSFIMSTQIQAGSALTCYNNLDDEKHMTSELATIQALEDFVKLCSDPLIPELTRQNEVQYTKTGKSLLHYFASTDEEKELYREKMRPLAKKYAEFLHFAITDVNDYPEMLPAVGLKAGSKTGLALENPNTGDMFPYTKKQKITPKTVEIFLDEIIDGKIKPWNQGNGQEQEDEEEIAHEEL